MADERKKSDPRGNLSAERSRRYFVDDVYLFIDNNLRLIRYCLYGVGAVGILVTARSLHVYKRFHTVTDIPAEFFKKNIPFRAKVKTVDQENRLHVEHIPILVSKWLPFKHTDSSLLVKIAGVHMSPRGCQWLTDNVMDRVIRVTPLQLNTGTIHSILHLEQGFFHRSMCVNKKLVDLGICKVAYPSPIPSSSCYIQLLDCLVAIESKADKKRTGLWGHVDMKDTKQSSLRKLKIWIQKKFVKQKPP